MKFFIVLAAVAAAVLIGREFLTKRADTAHSTTQRLAAGQGRVTLYTAAYCGDCAKAREFLRRQNVSFVEKDISTDPYAAQDLDRKRREVGLSSTRLPVVDIDGQLVEGFTSKGYSRLLQDL
jgi:glutaredoxin